MSEPTLFTRIIRGELPSHKIYEDNNTLAFLSIYPARPGHVLVVPKKEVAYIEDMAPEDFVLLMASVKKVVDRLAKVFGAEYRICIKVAGFDVPHVHVHVQPCKDPSDFRAHEDPSIEPDHAALAAMAKKLAF
jgi:histidine triad (HIT) family protein